MSWYIKCAGKPGPALDAALQVQFDNARRGCANNAAEVEAINAQEALVKAGIANVTASALDVSGSGHYIPRQEYVGGATPEQFACETKIATLLNWAE